MANDDASFDQAGVIYRIRVRGERYAGLSDRMGVRTKGTRRCTFPPHGRYTSVKELLLGNNSVCNFEIAGLTMDGMDLECVPGHKRRHQRVRLLRRPYKRVQTVFRQQQIFKDPASS